MGAGLDARLPNEHANSCAGDLAMLVVGAGKLRSISLIGQRGGTVVDEFVPVSLGFKLGSLGPGEIQEILDSIARELEDPGSEASREAARIGVSVRSLKVRQEPAFVLEAFLIAMAVKFAGGAAAAGGGLFFNQVIKPRIVRKKADGIGEAVNPPAKDV